MKIFRCLLSLNNKPQNNLTIRLAKTDHELETSYRITQESYEGSNLARKNESGLRINKHLALPSTFIVILLLKDEIIGTLSIICDSNFGLPIEKLIDINNTKTKGYRSCEVSSFAIKKTYQKGNGKLIIPLFKYVFFFVKNYLDIDLIFCSVHPRAKIFYQAIYNFVPISNAPIPYDKVEGKNAIPLYIDLNDTENFMYKIYGGKRDNKNLHYYMFRNKSMGCFVFPKEKYTYSISRSLSAKHINNILKNKSDILKGMSPKERSYLAESYHFKKYEYIFENTKQDSFKKRRKSPRFYINCQAMAFNEKRDKEFRFRLNEVSRFGVSGQLRIDSKKDLNNLKLRLHLNNTISIVLHLSYVSQKYKHIYGFKLIGDIPAEWHDFITHNEENLFSSTTALVGS